MMARAKSADILPLATDSALVTIILVEDDDADAKAIRRSMMKARIANPIIRACDGVEAMEILRGEAGQIPSRFIMLIDINMPRKNGIELLSEIRSDPALRKTVAFILTTSSDDRDVTAAYELNVAGYIVKSRVGQDFSNLINTLDGYWKIVELPDIT